MGVQEHVPRNRNVLFDRNNRNMFLEKLENATVGLAGERGATPASSSPGCVATLLYGDPAVRRHSGDPTVQRPYCAATLLRCEPALQIRRNNVGPHRRGACAVPYGTAKEACAGLKESNSNASRTKPPAAAPVARLLSSHTESTKHPSH